MNLSARQAPSAISACQVGTADSGSGGGRFMCPFSEPVVIR